MDAKDEGYLEWLERQFEDPAPLPTGSGWLHPWAITASTDAQWWYELYCRRTLNVIGGAVLFSLAALGATAAWSGLCWFINGGINGGW